jgi:hypothetical protein
MAARSASFSPFLRCRSLAKSLARRLDGRRGVLLVEDRFQARNELERVSFIFIPDDPRTHPQLDDLRAGLLDPKTSFRRAESAAERVQKLRYDLAGNAFQALVSGEGFVHDH